MCHIHLISENEREECSSVIVPNTEGGDEIEQQMRGCKLVRPLRLIDPIDQQRKTFFVFPDLAIKSNGRFRLVVRLISFERF
jgi:Velvet factor